MPFLKSLSMCAGLLALVLSNEFAQAQTAESVVLTDVYIEMSDGVRLATDIYLPPGTPTDGSVQVPCLVELTPYRKETRAAEGASFLPQAGFGLIEVDARGTGGSEGEYDIVFSLREQWDGAELVTWAAEQSGFCSDKVGMFGGSYSGIIQYLVASLPPEKASPYLRTIAPQRAFGDAYRDIMFHGGQMILSFGALWATGTTVFYLQPPTNFASSDGLNAWLDHVANNDFMLLPYIRQPYIDARYISDDSPEPFEQALYLDSSVLERMQYLNVPTYHLAGWFDAFTRGQLLTFQEGLAREKQGFGGPHYLVTGPWDHASSHFSFYPELQERLVEWYRHWLDDGAVPTWFGQKRSRIYVMGEGALNDDSGYWMENEQWPPQDIKYQRYYPTADGNLMPEVPESGETSWLWDPTTGLSEWPSRWDNAGFLPTSTRDQRIDGDRGGPTFVTPTLQSDMQLAGPISLRLQMSSIGLPGLPLPLPVPQLVDSAIPLYHDTDIVVKLSDVQPDGSAILISEGFLRASHRALDTQRSHMDGEDYIVPYHYHTRDTTQPVENGEVTEYWVEIWPTAKTFKAGHQLRIDLYSADTPNHLNLLKPALNTVHTGENTYLVLPMSAAVAADQPLTSQGLEQTRGGVFGLWSLFVVLIGLAWRRSQA